MKKEHIINLNQATINHLRTLFNQEFSMGEELTQEAVPSFLSKYLVQIGLRGKTDQICLLHGLSEEAVAKLLDEVLALANSETEKLELAKSALGELSNTVACELACLEPMLRDFGKLNPTPPLVWVTQGQIPDFVPGQGLSSHVLQGALEIHTHFALIKAPAGNGESQNWSPTQSLSICDPHGSR